MKKKILVAILFSLIPMSYLMLAKLIRVPTNLTLIDAVGIGSLMFIFCLIFSKNMKL